MTVSPGSIQVLRNSTGKSQVFKTEANFSLFGNSEHHQGLKIKTSGLKKSESYQLFTVVVMELVHMHEGLVDFLETSRWIVDCDRQGSTQR